MIWQQWFIIFCLLINLFTSTYKNLGPDDFPRTLGKWIFLGTIASVLYTGGFLNFIRLLTSFLEGSIVFLLKREQ